MKTLNWGHLAATVAIAVLTAVVGVASGTRTGDRRATIRERAGCDMIMVRMAGQIAWETHRGDSLEHEIAIRDSIALAASIRRLDLLARRHAARRLTTSETRRASSDRGPSVFHRIASGAAGWGWGFAAGLLVDLVLDRHGDVTQIVNIQAAAGPARPIRHPDYRFWHGGPTRCGKRHR